VGRGVNPRSMTQIVGKKKTYKKKSGKGKRLGVKGIIRVIFNKKRNKNKPEFLIKNSEQEYRNRGKLQGLGTGTNLCDTTGGDEGIIVGGEDIGCAGMWLSGGKKKKKEGITRRSEDDNYVNIKDQSTLKRRKETDRKKHKKKSHAG